MKSLLTIGDLKEVELLDPKTNELSVLKPKNTILGWDTKQKRFCVVRKVKTRVNNPTALSGDVSKAHETFHNTGPSQRPFVAENPAPKGKLTRMGLIKSLTYFVPRKIKSPGKNTYLWHHAFGDTGHKGGSDYPASVMPALMQDSVGNWFIKRRKGNIFSVDEWLRG